MFSDFFSLLPPQLPPRAVLQPARHPRRPRVQGPVRLRLPHLPHRADGREPHRIQLASPRHRENIIFYMQSPPISFSINICIVIVFRSFRRIAAIRKTAPCLASESWCIFFEDKNCHIAGACKKDRTKKLYAKKLSERDRCSSYAMRRCGKT